MTDTALIAGGAGFVGVHLARALVDCGWRVVLVDDYSRGRADDVVGALLDDGAELIEHDLARPLGETFMRLRPALIVHLAAVVGVRNVTARPDRVVSENMLTLHNVLEFALAARPRAFVFSSTSEVADGAVALGLAEPPVSEEVPFVCPDLTLPRASYAMSKAYGEMLVRTLGERHGLPVRVVRFFNVYGPRMGHDHVIPELIGRILSGTQSVDVYGAEPTRSFCYISDAIAAVVALTELPSPDALVVNVGNDREERSIEDLARRLLALTGSSASLRAHPAPAGSPRRRCPDLSRLHALTGLVPKVTLDEGLRHTLEHYAAVAH